MLRILFISLFVANLLLFGFWNRDSAVQPNATAKPAVAENSNVPTIHLFSEMMEDQGLLSDNRQCFSLGPFHSTDDVDKVYTLLLDVTVNIKERQTQALVEKGYWVYLPPHRDLLEANEALFSLQALGLKDIGVIYNGEWARAISLGYFLRQENAVRRKKSLEDRDFAPLIRVQRQAEDRYWLDYEQTPGSDLIALDMQSRPNDFMQRALPCPEQIVSDEVVAKPAEQVATAVQAPVSVPEVDNAPEPEDTVSIPIEIDDPEPEEPESASPENRDPEPEQAEEPEEAEILPPEESDSEPEQSAGTQPEDDEPQQEEPETQLSTDDNDPASEPVDEPLTVDTDEPQSNESVVLPPIESDEPMLEQGDDSLLIEETDASIEEVIIAGPEELEQQLEQSNDAQLDDDTQLPEDLDASLPVEIDEVQTSDGEQLPASENEPEDDGETAPESGEITDPDPGDDADPYDGDEIEIEAA